MQNRFNKRMLWSLRMVAITFLLAHANTLLAITSTAAIVVDNSEMLDNSNNPISVKQSLHLQQEVRNLENKVETIAEDCKKEPPDSVEIDTLFNDLFLIDEEEVEEEFLVYYVEEMPRFKGGDVREFRDYVQQNIVYPKEAEMLCVSGRVFVQFIVDEKGDVTNVKIVRGVHPLFDREVMRVVEASPKWEPGKQRGKTVKVTFTVPVLFHLNSDE